MAEFVRIFSIRDVALVHRDFIETIREFELADRARVQAKLKPNNQATVARIRKIQAQLELDLDELARTTARNATRFMRDIEAKTEVRSGTGRRPHMRERLTARALPRQFGFSIGAVGIADMAILDRAVNPAQPQYGSYWRAQEFGTGAGDALLGIQVPSQRGRILRGYFYEAGYRNPERPLAIYAGGGGPHPLFLPGRPTSFGGARLSGGTGPGGGLGGYGTIQKEITGRHFIRDGANQARVIWRTEIGRVQGRAVGGLRQLLVRP